MYVPCIEMRLSQDDCRPDHNSAKRQICSSCKVQERKGSSYERVKGPSLHILGAVPHILQCTELERSSHAKDKSLRMFLPETKFLDYFSYCHVSSCNEPKAKPRTLTEDTAREECLFLALRLIVSSFSEKGQCTF